MSTLKLLNSDELHINGLIDEISEHIERKFPDSNTLSNFENLIRYGIIESYEIYNSEELSKMLSETARQQNITLQVLDFKTGHSKIERSEKEYRFGKIHSLNCYEPNGTVVNYTGTLVFSKDVAEDGASFE